MSWMIVRGDGGLSGLTEEAPQEVNDMVEAQWSEEQGFDSWESPFLKTSMPLTSRDIYF